jgi:hypothetical protein
MKRWSIRQCIQGLLGFCVVAASSLLLLGCSQESPSQSAKPPAQQTTKAVAHASPEDGHPAYPAIVYDLPRCYDFPPKKMDECEDGGFYDVYLSFRFLEDSESVVWKDITNLRSNNTSWRLLISRASTGEYLDGTNWKPITNNDKIRMKTKPDTGGKLPREVLLRAEFEFCSDQPANCAVPSATRPINFLLHEFPEKDEAAQVQEKKPEKKTEKKKL